ncbi:MAG: hypothetical protein V4671_20550, partial [Armatimonadota bacterium]
VAESLKLAAENEREAATQAVETTRVVAEAHRRQRQEIIQKETQTQQLLLEERARADAEAYTREKAADADKTAAVKSAEAMLLRARADKESKELEAQGEQAKEMVPVAVEAERVVIERQRIEVLQAELEARSSHSSISVQLEIARMVIEADKDARIAAAEAMGKAFASANMTIWGDPESVKKMSESFLKGQSTSALFEGALANLPQPMREMMNGAIDRFVQAPGSDAVSVPAPIVEASNGSATKPSTVVNDGIGKA